MQGNAVFNQLVLGYDRVPDVAEASPWPQPPLWGNRAICGFVKGSAEVLTHFPQPVPIEGRF